MFDEDAQRIHHLLDTNQTKAHCSFARVGKRSAIA
jgi:hypothetical protein